MDVLLIEDDIDLAETISEFLQTRNMTVDHAYDGITGLHLATITNPDVIVLDIGLPRVSGFEVCRRLREEADLHTPILMLTARDQLQDKLAGFKQGADDYLVKPFALAELVCRIQALARRAQQAERPCGVLHIGDLTVNTKTRTATRRDVPLQLTTLEFDILAILCAASPAALGKDELARRVWHEDYVSADTIRSHMYQLRRIVDRPFDTPLIHTIRGYGHALRVPNA